MNNISKLTTYIVDQFKLSPLVNTISFEKTQEMDYNKSNIYPLVNIDIVNSTIEDNQILINYTFTIVEGRDFQDEINNDKLFGSNLVDNLNECHAIGVKFINYFTNQNNLQDIDIDLDLAPQLRFVKLKDGALDGVQFSMTFSMFNDISGCNVGEEIAEEGIHTNDYLTIYANKGIIFRDETGEAFRTSLGDIYLNTNNLESDNNGLHLGIDANGKIVVVPSGIINDSYTTEAILNGNVIEFSNSIEGQNFYSVDLTPILSGISYDDIYVTGMTFNNGNYDLIINQNDGSSFTQNLGILASDMNVTGGTYDINTGIVTFTNNSGGTFTVSGFTSGMTDSYTTSANLSGNSIVFNNNIQGPNFYSIDLNPLLSGKTDNINFNSHTGNTNNPHQTSFNQLTSTAHTHTISNVTGLQTALDSKLDKDITLYPENPLTLTGTEKIIYNDAGTWKKSDFNGLINLSVRYHTQVFEWITGPQEFVCSGGISTVLAVFVNGQEIDPIRQYTYDTIKVTISDTLPAPIPEPIVVSVIYAKSPLSVAPYVTDAEISGTYVKINAPILKGSLTKIESTNVDINSTPLTPNTFGAIVKNNIIIGKNNQSNSNNNLGFGDNNQFNSGGNDVVFGSNNQINQSNTLIFGKNIQSNAGDDFIVGSNLQSNLINSFTIGYNPVLSTGFDLRVSRTNGIQLGQLTGLGTKPIGVDNNGKIVVSNPRKEIVFSQKGNVTQFSVTTTESNAYLDKSYKIKKIIVLFKTLDLDVTKTIPIGIYEEDVDTPGNIPQSNLIYTVNCTETFVTPISNKIFNFDVDIQLNVNKILNVYTLGFTAGTQTVKDAIITLVIEEV